MNKLVLKSPKLSSVYKKVRPTNKHYNGRKHNVCKSKKKKSFSGNGSNKKNVCENLTLFIDIQSFSYLEQGRPVNLTRKKCTKFLDGSAIIDHLGIKGFFVESDVGKKARVPVTLKKMNNINKHQLILTLQPKPNQHNLQ